MDLQVRLNCGVPVTVIAANVVYLRVYEGERSRRTCRAKMAANQLLDAVNTERDVSSIQRGRGSRDIHFSPAHACFGDYMWD